MAPHKNQTSRRLATHLLSVCCLVFMSATTYPQNLYQPDKPYRILPGDLIEIRIADAQALDGTHRVHANGSFLMPFLNCINAKGKTPDELAAFLAERLRGRYLKDPKVQVTIRNDFQASATRSLINEPAFWIYGEANSPGWFTLQGGMTIRDALTKAKGVTLNAGDFGYILRYHQDNCKGTKVEFNIGEVIKDGKNNQRLEPGDEIFIPAGFSPNRRILKPLLPSPGPNPRPIMVGPFGNLYALTKMPSASHQ